jgi:hypothetical protein
MSNQMSPWFLLVLVPLVLLAVGILPGFLAALLQKRRVWAYEPVDEKAAYPETDYARWVGESAARLGYEYLGVFHDSKGRLYKIRYDFWVSPAHDVIAFCGVGTLMSIPLKAIWLYTKLSDGRCLMTTDNSAAIESDLSGMTEPVLVTNADFDELLARHRRRVDEAPLPVSPFAHADSFADFMAFRTARVDHLVEIGFARYLDDRKDSWRYTPRGALAVAAATYFKQFASILRNTPRDSIARPGEVGYVPSTKAVKRTGGSFKLLQMVFLLMMVMSGTARFTQGRAVNPAQALFRVSIATIGLVGFIVTLILSKTQSRLEATRND